MRSKVCGWKPKIFALTICLLGFALLVHELDARSLWGEETYRTYSTDAAQGDLRGFVVSIARGPEPPFYCLCLWIWRSFAGHSEFALRFPSTVFGILSIALVYPLGKKMIGRTAGLMAMGLMSISPFLILSSRMVQYYCLLLFLSLTSYWFFDRLLGGQNAARAWLGYVVSSTLGIYTHYLFAFVLAAQGLIVLTEIARRRQPILRLIGSQMMVALLFAPWVPAMVRQAIVLRPGLDAFASTGPAMWALSSVYPFFAWIVGETIYPWNPAALVGFILGLCLTAQGLVSLMLRARETARETNCGRPEELACTERQRLRVQIRTRSLRTSQVLIFAILILLPLILTLVTVKQFTMTSGDPFLASRAIFCVPFIHMLIAEGIRTTARPGLRAAIAAVLSIVLGFSTANYYLGREFHNPNHVLQTQDIANLIAQQSEATDVFISDPMVAFGYYIEEVNPEAVHFFAHDTRAVKSYIEKHRPPNIWLILLCRAVETESPATVELVPWLNEAYKLEHTSRYAPLDETYAYVQELFLRKRVCEYKVLVYRYTRIHGEL